MMLSKVITESGIDGTIINRVALLTTWVMNSVQNVVTLFGVVKQIWIFGSNYINDIGFLFLILAIFLLPILFSPFLLPLKFIENLLVSSRHI